MWLVEFSQDLPHNTCAWAWDSFVLTRRAALTLDKAQPIEECASDVDCTIIFDVDGVLIVLGASEKEMASSWLGAAKL